MSQAQTNIGPVNATRKAVPQPAQRQAVQSTQQGARRPISAEQRVKLSAAQFAYMANDPRWTEHRRKLAVAQEARRMTLLENEVAAIVALRKEGETYAYISKKIGVCRDVITRELAALGIRDELANLGRGTHRTTLLDNEVTAIMEMRKKGRTFEYIAAEIGVCRNMMTRELAALGHSTERVRSDRRVRRGKGFWRSFDPA